MVSIDSTKSRIVYRADGRTRDFGFPFRVWKPEEVKVVISYAGMEEEVKTGFSILLSSTGGTVRFNAAPTHGEVIAILRAMPFTQEDEFAQCSRFDPEELETRLDKDCAERQQLLEAVSRAIKLPATSEQTPEEYQADYFSRVENAKTAAKNEIDALVNSAKTEIAANRIATQNSANAANQSKLSAQASQTEIERLLANEITSALRQSLAAANAAKGFAADVEASVIEAGERAAACILDQVREFAWLAKEYAASASASSCAAAMSNEQTWLRVKGMTQAAGEEAADCILEQASSMAEISTTQAGAAALSASTAAGYAENMAAMIREYAQKTADEIAAQITACIETVCIDSVEMSRSHSMAAAASASAAAGSMQAVVIAVECAAEEAAAKAAEMTAQCCQEICNSCIEMSMENVKAAVLAANSAHQFMVEAKQADICVEADMRRAADLKLDERVDGLMASQQGFISLVDNLTQKIEGNSAAIATVSGQLQNVNEDLSEQIASAKSLAQGADTKAQAAQISANQGIADAAAAQISANQGIQAASAAQISANQGLQDAALAQASANQGIEAAAQNLITATNALNSHKIDAEAHPQAFEAAAGELLSYSGGKLNALPQGYNSEQFITESGNWIAPIEAWYDVFLIGGGNGGVCNLYDKSCEGGISGRITRALIFLEKGQTVPVVIGAGGKGAGYMPSTAAADLAYTGGGTTSFGSLSTSGKPCFRGVSVSQIMPGTNKFYASFGSGGGLGGSAGEGNPTWYGGGGGSHWHETAYPNPVYSDGKQGLVHVRWFDPAKVNGPVS